MIQSRWRAETRARKARATRGARPRATRHIRPSRTWARNRRRKRSRSRSRTRPRAGRVVMTTQLQRGKSSRKKLRRRRVRGSAPRRLLLLRGRTRRAERRRDAALRQETRSWAFPRRSSPRFKPRWRRGPATCRAKSRWSAPSGGTEPISRDWTRCAARRRREPQRRLPASRTCLFLCSTIRRSSRATRKRCGWTNERSARFGAASRLIPYRARKPARSRG